MTDLSMPARGNDSPPTTSKALPVAVSVARDMLARYANVDRDIHALTEAHTATREALRILLRAVDTEPQTEEQKAQAFIDRHFPVVAALLDAERGEGQ